MLRMKKVVLTLMLAMFFACLAIPQAMAAKNVIMLVPDGCSTSIQTLSRWLQGKPLNVDPIMSGSVITPHGQFRYHRVCGCGHCLCLRT